MTVKMTLSDDDNDKNDAINIDNDDEYDNRKYVSCFMLASIDDSENDIERRW